MLSRYFMRLAYNGTPFCGWQIQPKVDTVQGSIEQILSQLYNQPIQIVGCGRTDTAVHASDYYAHVDLPSGIFTKQDLTYKLSNLLPKAIRIIAITKVAADAHARFDATKRSYVYKMVFYKDPFRQDTVYKYDQAGRPDFDLMNQVAALLLDYKEFFPFCKAHADVETYKCTLTQSEWIMVNEDEWHYHVTANRFLRGMVRLIVGMTLNVGLKRTQIKEVQQAMDQQSRLERAWSVPAKGLYLNQIEYPYL